MSPEESQAIELLDRVPYGRLATSRRALPLLALARHIVCDGHLVLRMHGGLGHHEACDGSVVAYGADNLSTAAPGTRALWTVQLTATAELLEPTRVQRARFGALPAEVDGQAFDPVYLRLHPQFASVHTLDWNSSPHPGHVA
ncbi:pyridoxamine 5'-phosphate oxidase family protein [Streptomyces sp. NBC_00102]|uniref:pyridoxamine 5'-phosphate oxidase family protein n=1 Tax=Streptomyces sp. NBC_00102 TaxID=2975652 RepID=UPI0022577BE5|nr:pyridoxamine 5'-phosphate oxidase family protein [Streptomyces sp. NBC_00102]MCX5398348.1 pyridoxamine 5'-phosphate oxidase family protein [Streptomyces sp. NBC_00102]